MSYEYNWRVECRETYGYYGYVVNLLWRTRQCSARLDQSNEMCFVSTCITYIIFVSISSNCSTCAVSYGQEGTRSGQDKASKRVRVGRFITVRYTHYSISARAFLQSRFYFDVYEYVEMLLLLSRREASR